MAGDAQQEMANYRRTFKARAKGKLKRWFIEGNTARGLETVADQFREEARIIFSGDALDDHLQYVDLLADASEQAVEEASYNVGDPSTWELSRENSTEQTRDGDLFEQAIDELRKQRQTEA